MFLVRQWPLVAEANYYSRKGGSQVERYKKQQNQHKEEALVNGWVTQTRDFHTGQGIKTMDTLLILEGKLG